MASCACVVTLLLAACTPSLLAAPSPDARRLSDGRGRLPSHPDANATSSHEELSFRRHQTPHEVDLLQRNYPPQHNTYNNVRRRHRKRKLVTGVWRPSTRRSEPGEQARTSNRNKLQDSDVAIILAKLNTGTDGTPSAVRPYRLQAGGRDITPLHDDSDETLNNILQALKLQVAGPEKVTDLNRRVFDNTTPPEDSLELEKKLAPLMISKSNDSTEAIQKEPQLTSLENLAEAYTEPTYESVIQSRADDDSLKAETPTLPSEYFDDNKTDELKSLDNDDKALLNEDTKTSIESKIALGLEPIVSEPADTNVGVEEELAAADMLEPEPTICSQTESEVTGSCLADNAVTRADSQCDACKEGDYQCDACKYEGSRCEACKYEGSQCEACRQADNNDVLDTSLGICPAVPILAGRNAEEQLQDHKDDIEDAATKKDVGLRINRKSYKISIIFQ